MGINITSLKSQKYFFCQHKNKSPANLWWRQEFRNSYTMDLDMGTWQKDDMSSCHQKMKVLQIAWKFARMIAMSCSVDLSVQIRDCWQKVFDEIFWSAQTPGREFAPSKLWENQVSWTRDAKLCKFYVVFNWTNNKWATWNHQLLLTEQLELDMGIWQKDDMSSCHQKMKVLQISWKLVRMIAMLCRMDLSTQHRDCWQKVFWQNFGLHKLLARKYDVPAPGKKSCFCYWNLDT